MALTTATQRCRSNQWLVGWNAQKFDSGADRYKNFFLFFFQEFLRGLSPSPPLASRRHITVFVTSVCATTKTQTATLVDKSWNEPMPYIDFFGLIASALTFNAAMYLGLCIRTYNS
ncbi:hypothetical protein AFLA_003844 [Aspergillus flavus NRRL3357]|nr:hypothetical protein AFLA_003844 [Aspergillus flavus NRRL3357]